MDCSSVGYGGGPPKNVHGGTAIVKWLQNADGTPISPEDSHQEWPIEQESNGIVLARDPWDGKLHWLFKGGEYRLWVKGNLACHIVEVQTANCGS